MRKVRSILVIVGMLLLTELAFGALTERQVGKLGRRAAIEKSQVKLDWQIDYSGEVGPDNYFPGTVSVDKKGNIYLSARYYIPVFNSFMNYFKTLIKLDSNGNELWEIKYEDEDIYTSISFIDSDSKDNIYVNLSNRYMNEVRIIKYDKAGNFIWERTFIEDYPSMRPQDIQIDRKGNIYLATSETIDNAIKRYTFMKVSSDGDVLWQRNQDYPLNSIPRPNLIFPIHWNITHSIVKVDRRGDVVTVYSNGNWIVLTKYDKNGNVLWADSFEEEDYSFYLHDVAIDSSGNICLSIVESQNAGLSGPVEIGLRAIPKDLKLGLQMQDANSFIIKYESNGDIAFVLDQNIPYNAHLMIDRVGNMYVTGGDLSGIYEDVYNTIQKFDADGNLKWSHISTVLFPHPLAMFPDNYCVDLDEQTGSLYIAFQCPTGGKILQKIDSKGRMCYEKELEDADDMVHKNLRINLIKTKKQGIYIFEDQGIRNMSASFLNGPWLSKFVEKNVKGRKRALKKERFPKKRH